MRAHRAPPAPLYSYVDSVPLHAWRRDAAGDPPSSEQANWPCGAPGADLGGQDGGIGPSGHSCSAARAAVRSDRDRGPIGGDLAAAPRGVRQRLQVCSRLRFQASRAAAWRALGRKHSRCANFTAGQPLSPLAVHCWLANVYLVRLVRLVAWWGSLNPATEHKRGHSHSAGRAHFPAMKRRLSLV